MHGGPYPASAPAQTVVVTLPAEIDITGARPLCGEVGAALVSGATIVVADMTATTFCDSSGAHILVLAWEQAAVSGVELRIVVPSATVRHGLADGPGWVSTVLPEPGRGADSRATPAQRGPAMAGPQLTGGGFRLGSAAGTTSGSDVADG